MRRASPILAAPFVVAALFALTTTSAGFRDNLRAEQRSVREDMGDLVNYWPILNLGIRYGVGGDDRRRRGGR